MVLSDPATTWLNLTNGVLGIAVLLCCALIAGSVVYEFTVRANCRARIIRNADAAVRALLQGRTRPPAH
jgi:hypothetical protein